MAQRLTKRQLQDRADNTFILTLDGDVDFEPRSVVLLLDRMRRDNIVGAVCGRIHPVGAGKYILPIHTQTPTHVMLLRIKDAGMQRKMANGQIVLYPG